MIKKILVGAPTATGADALHAAAELATTCGAELVVMAMDPTVDARTVFDPDGAPGCADATPELRRRFPALAVRAHHGGGTSVRNVCRAVRKERPDLVVMPRSCHAANRLARSRRASRAALGSCPVLVVGP